MAQDGHTPGRLADRVQEMSAGGLQLRVEYIRRGAVQLLVGIVMPVFRMPLFLFNYLNGGVIPARWTGINLVVGAIPVKKV